MKNRLGWKSEYNIGVEDVDNQHRNLFKMLGSLNETLSAEKRIDACGDIIKSLVEYTQTHFADEEKFMADINYKGLDRHKLLHQNLINEVKKVLLTLKADGNYGPNELIDFLYSWIIDHILKEDIKIGEAYRSTISPVKAFSKS